MARKIRDCGCGCGKKTKGGMFLPGHDMRVKGHKPTQVVDVETLDREMLLRKSEEDFSRGLDLEMEKAGVDHWLLLPEGVMRRLLTEQAEAARAAYGRDPVWAETMPEEKIRRARGRREAEAARDRERGQAQPVGG